MRGGDDPLSRYPWWAALKHGGLLIAPSKLAEHFAPELPPLEPWRVNRLRRAVVRFQEKDGDSLPHLLHTVFEDVLDLGRSQWRRGSDVDSGWTRRAVTGEAVRPRWLWQGLDGAVLPLFIADAALGAAPQRGVTPRLGVGRGRRAVSRVVEWLRRADQKLALLTNGRQWRLIHAGSDYHAWCEWDSELWFEEGEPSLQVTALRQLLGATALRAAGRDQPSRLVAAVLASRKGQAELSAVLGERVRRAVEHLIRSSSQALAPLGEPGPRQISPRELYLAASRLIMRCVVILFAEARDLLPGDNVLYHSSYGLQGLREQLDRLAGGRAPERLRHSHAAWPRLISLFHLVYAGSAHEALPIPRYGGGLFRPGDPQSPDPVRRALAAFEAPRNDPSDAVVHQLLELLTRSRIKVRQGTRSTWVEAPVDFSDLSTEYIGILYEGLLDFELRRAGEEPMVFLNVGDQPALPFIRLYDMTSTEIAELLAKLKTSRKKAPKGEDEAQDEDDGGDAADAEEAEEPGEEETAAEEDLAEAEGDEDGEGDEEDETTDEAAPDADLRREFSERIHDWAVSAVRAAKLVPTPRGDADSEPAAWLAYHGREQKSAKALIKKVVMPGEWFLVRWGGTRKGSGTFYTPPQIAVPTARRALRPLAYEPVSEVTDPETGLVTVTGWRPKKPEEILALKVCDPAMGSGSFLAAALRFLVDALVESLYHHRRLAPEGERTVCKLADGLPADHPSQETLPLPMEQPEFEDHLRARLKRHVVERCLYGVDLDPLAVELARMALWVETLDPRLPFGFLDHKLKPGNALVGCWFDRFRDYPVMAWEREGGDGNHTRFVHHHRQHAFAKGKRKGETERRGDVWTQAIKDHRNQVVKPALADWIRAHSGDALEFMAEGLTPADVHDEALALFEELHDLPVHEAEQREAMYRQGFRDNPRLRGLKEVFDTWCAVWFWPGGRLADAPTPASFLAPPEPTRRLVETLARELRFFHWELEFPDVFTGPDSGFDAVVGNPPWETQKPNSKEYFSNLDPLYRTYGKQEALDKQQEYFTRLDGAEREWLSYKARIKALSNWVKHAGHPFGDPETAPTQNDRFSFSRAAKQNGALHRAWRARRRERRGYADPQHPFLHQGSADVNTYKMFLEATHALLTRGGRLGLLLPSGLYSDKGSAPLRRLLLAGCRWSHLYAFQNERFVFRDIDHRFKIIVLAVVKGGSTATLRTRFRIGPGDSPELHEIEDDLLAEERYLVLPTAAIRRFSPQTGALLEIRSHRDLAILEKLYDRGVLLGDDGPDGWGIRYAREFDMTNDSKLFPPRPKWEAKGYRPDEYGHWLKGAWRPYDGPANILRRPPGLVVSADGSEAIEVEEIEDVALPLYQGVMINHFDFAASCYEAVGRGQWTEAPWPIKSLQPKYLMSAEAYLSSEKWRSDLRLGFRDVTLATNSRTFIASLLPTAPTGNTLGTLTSIISSERTMLLGGILNSLTLDWLVRQRLVGSHLNLHVIEEIPVPWVSQVNNAVSLFILALSFPSTLFAREWQRIMRAETPAKAWKQYWAVSRHERVRLLACLDAAVAAIHDLAPGDYRRVLADCDYPPAALRSNSFNRTLDPNPA